MLVLGARDVRSILDESVDRVSDIVSDAYVAHARGQTTLPHSGFLHMPDQKSRIIALPAFVDAGAPVAGMKWIASFPGNHARGLDRASAVVVLNSAETGRPEALLEAAAISAWRTAASAALANRWLSAGTTTTGVSLVGCGVINRAILRFLLATCPELEHVSVYDRDPAAAEAFAAGCRQARPELEMVCVPTIDDALGSHELISFATTAATPHTDLAACRPGSLVLHVSLRDIVPEAITGCRNIVDDPDHVCRANTSLHLAEQRRGDRSFIHGSLGDIILGAASASRDPEKVTVFSPFGLGILDIAVADHVYRVACERDAGTRIADFNAGPDRPAADKL